MFGNNDLKLLHNIYIANQWNSIDFLNLNLIISVSYFYIRYKWQEYNLFVLWMFVFSQLI